jgi:hypothetical protein
MNANSESSNSSSAHSAASSSLRHTVNDNEITSVSMINQFPNSPTSHAKESFDNTDEETSEEAISFDFFTSSSSSFMMNANNQSMYSTVSRPHNDSLLSIMSTIPEENLVDQSSRSGPAVPPVDNQGDDEEKDNENDEIDDDVAEEGEEDGWKTMNDNESIRVYLWSSKKIKEDFEASQKSRPHHLSREEMKDPSAVANHLNKLIDTFDALNIRMRDNNALLCQLLAGVEERVSERVEKMRDSVVKIMDERSQFLCEGLGAQHRQIITFES